MASVLGGYGGSGGTESSGRELGMVVEVVVMVERGVGGLFKGEVRRWAVAVLVAARRASRPALMALEPARPSWSGMSAEGVDVHVEEGTCCCCACRRAARAAAGEAAEL